MRIFLVSTFGLHLFVHLEHFLDCRTRDEFLVPLIALRVLCFPVETLEQHRRQHVPRNKHEVSVTDFIPDEILVARFVEVQFDDAEDTLDLLLVALRDGGEILLWMELHWIWEVSFMARSVVAGLNLRT